ncbi:MAG: sulfotransferase family 2 domain-containing protein [Chitinophagales bacterium]
MNPYKLKHFFINKYLVDPITKNKYYITYNYKYKTMWFQNYKVASRTIKKHFNKYTPNNKDIFSSGIDYIPAMCKDYFKFAFIREPSERFISAWKDKVLQKNYFNFNVKEREKYQNLTDFISWVEKQDIDRCDKHIRSQNSLIDLNEIDFLGRFENFNNDFCYLCETIGLPISQPEKLNQSKKANINFTPSELKRIKNIYSKDYRFFYPHLS